MLTYKWIVVIALDDYSKTIQHKLFKSMKLSTIIKHILKQLKMKCPRNISDLCNKGSIHIDLAPQRPPELTNKLPILVVYCQKGS